jgi:DNA invertase Pin-like site-specific DNA recombinase
MSWGALLALIADELGPAAAKRVEARARAEMAGVRLTITGRINQQIAEAAAPGRPREAAKALGVHPTTVYRALRRPIVR